jgi:flagellar biosynthesis component FlhA
VKNPIKEIIFIAGGIIFFAVILVPIPGIALDILTILNLGFCATMLLIISSRKKRIAILPTLLLASSVFSLALFTASVRLILTKGPDLDSFLLRTVSAFARGSNIVFITGLAIFCIVIFIQVMFISRISVQLAEIAARFYFNEMQIRMMTVETELSSGRISEKDAQNKKSEIQQEADFYGAFDGCSKFISGNSKFGIFILIITLLGGFIVGKYVIHGEGSIFHLLRPYAGYGAGASFLFYVQNFLLFLIVNNTTKIVHKNYPNHVQNQGDKSDIPVDTLSLEIGYKLIPLVDRGKSTRLFEDIQEIRKTLKNETGVVVPSIRIVDNLTLDSQGYSIKIKGKEAGRGTVDMDMPKPEETIIRHLDKILRANILEFSEERLG